MRTTKELRDKIEQAAAASGRSLVQEVEFRLERSFLQQELVAGLDEVRRDFSESLQQWKAGLVIFDEALFRQANKPKPSDLARFADLPEDTSKQTAPEKKEDPK